MQFVLSLGGILAMIVVAMLLDRIGVRSAVVTPEGDAVDREGRTGIL